MVRGEIIGLGILAAIVGTFPIIGKFLKFIPAMITTGWIFAGIMILIGVIHIAWGFSPMAMKPEIGIVGILIVVMGLLPILAKYLKFIPASISTGYIYAGIIVAIGLIELFYGAAPNTF
jgi:hypothetical protein